MKKIYLGFIASIIIVSNIIYSCKKEYIFQSEETVSVSLDSRKQILNALRQIQPENVNWTPYLNWSGEIAKMTDSSMIIFVPLNTILFGEGFDEKSYQEYVMNVFDKNGILQDVQLLSTYSKTPQAFVSSEWTYREEVVSVSDRSFTGTCTYYDLKTRRVKASDTYVSGDIANHSITSERASGSNKVSGCHDWYWINYSIDLSTGIKTILSVVPAFSICDGDCQDMSVPDKNFKVKFKVMCGGGGSGTGDGTGDGSSTLELQADIYDLLTDPCFKQIVNMLKLPAYGGNASSIVSNDIGVALNLTFGLSNKWNIVFKDATTVTVGGQIAEASTGASINSQTNDVDVEITLSKTALASASREYVAATVIHEIEHAYLRERHYPSISDHEFMATSNTRDIMADALRRLFPYSLSTSDSEALTWGGLNEDSQGNAITNAWTTFKSSHSSQAYQIQVTNSNFANGSSGHTCP